MEVFLSDSIHTNAEYIIASNDPEKLEAAFKNAAKKARQAADIAVKEFFNQESDKA